jgi:hypothetical protein
MRRELLQWASPIERFESDAEAVAGTSRLEQSEPTALSQLFLAQVLGQLARHVVSRDLGLLVGSEKYPNLTAVRSLLEKIGDAAEELASQVPTFEPTVASWEVAVRQAFAIARELPEG